MPITARKVWGGHFRLPVFFGISRIEQAKAPAPHRTARRLRGLAILLAVGGAASAQNDDAPWVPVIAKLASSLSQNDAVGALGVFDSHMKDYGAIESNINALVAQTGVLCAIDVVREKEVRAEPGEEAHTLDVDWFMQLQSQADAGPTERRRERVEVRIAKIRGKWKITSLAPLSILAPIHIN
jgi:hypothetical protein